MAKTEDNITVTEVVRNTSAGRFSYTIFKDKVARRAFRRGRPHYDLVGVITVSDKEKVITKEIPVESQLGRLLTAEPEASTSETPKKGKKA